MWCSAPSEEDDGYLKFVFSLKKTKANKTAIQFLSKAKLENCSHRLPEIRSMSKVKGSSGNLQSA